MQVASVVVAGLLAGDRAEPLKGGGGATLVAQCLDQRQGGTEMLDGRLVIALKEGDLSGADQHPRAARRRDLLRPGEQLLEAGACFVVVAALVPERPQQARESRPIVD